MLKTRSDGTVFISSYKGCHVTRLFIVNQRRRVDALNLILLNAINTNHVMRDSCARVSPALV